MLQCPFSSGRYTEKPGFQRLILTLLWHIWTFLAKTIMGMWQSCSRVHDGGLKPAMDLQSSGYATKVLFKIAWELLQASFALRQKGNVLEPKARTDETVASTIVQFLRLRVFAHQNSSWNCDWRACAVFNTIDLRKGVQHHLHGWELLQQSLNHYHYRHCAFQLNWYFAIDTFHARVLSLIVSPVLWWAHQAHHRNRSVAARGGTRKGTTGGSEGAREAIIFSTVNWMST